MHEAAAPRPRWSWRSLVPLGILLAAGIVFFAAGGGRYLSFTALAAHHGELSALVARWGVGAALVYIAVYALLTTLAVPGVAIVTIAGGSLFGTGLGGVYTVIGATSGATISFLAARAGLGGLTRRAGPLALRLEAGFRANAFSYLLVLRLMPLFPFWLVNLVAAALGVGLRVYVVATFFGIIPVTFVYAGLGHGLGTILAEGRTPDRAILLRPGIMLPLVALALLSLLPVAYKWVRRVNRAPRSMS
jgi:uncharacterized membrane protein YdjX (TVP38/TMEM64 family)